MSARNPRPSSAEPLHAKQVSIVARAAAMLECFTAERKEIRLAELAALVSLPKPTVFRIAVILTRVGLLEQTASGSYRLGFANLRLSEALLASMEVRTVTRPIMERLRNALGETVVLSVKDGDFRYNVDSVEGAHAIGQTQQIGAPIPLYAGAASRVILSAMDDAELDDYLRRTTLAPFTASTITEADRLRREIEATRRRGYVCTAGEFTRGGYAIACLVPTPKALGLAALHISVPLARFRPSFERKAVSTLMNELNAVTLRDGGPR